VSFFLGSYATSPCSERWNEDLETAYWSSLATSPHLRGLEYPFSGKLHPHDEAWALCSLPKPWDIVLTLLPGTMDRLAANPHFGLASDDEAGRQAAVAFVREASLAVMRLNDAAARARVVAVELHSAPRRGVAGVSSSPEALARSLAEVAGFNWCGAALALEHCDAYSPDLPPIKGFLCFEEEIAAIKASGAPVGIAINWGRSVLEVRDPARPLEQIRLARAEGLLRGLMFSGCSGAETPWGVWQDSHMPHAPCFGLDYAAPGSLMTAEAMEAALAAAGPDLLFIGGKVTAQPKSADLATRVGLNLALLSALDRLRPKVI